MVVTELAHVAGFEPPSNRCGPARDDPLAERGTKKPAPGAAMPLTRVPPLLLRTLRRREIFLPESAFRADSLTVSVQPTRAMACISISICAHVQNRKQ